MAFLILTWMTPGYPEVHGTLHTFLRRGGRDTVTRGGREGCEPGRADAGRLPGASGLLRHHRGVPRIPSDERGARGAPRLARAGHARGPGHDPRDRRPHPRTSGGPRNTRGSSIGGTSSVAGARYGARLRGSLQRHGRGPALRFFRRAAGHLPQRPGRGKAARRREAVLGVALYRPGHRLPGEARLWPPRGAPRGRRAADGGPRGLGDPVHLRPDHRPPEDRLHRRELRPGRGARCGLVTADLYQVRAGAIVTKRVSRKALAIRPLP